MVDWNGLFKWSMKYQNQDEPSKDIKPMDKETVEWLTQALEEYTFDEAKRMKAIIDEIHKPEENTKDDEEKRFELLEELQELTEGIENARVLNTIGGLPVLMNVMLNSAYKTNRLSALLTFMGCNQNNAIIQEAAIANNGFKLINVVINPEKFDVKEREHAFSALSSMLRGEHLEGKRQFIDADGVELLTKLMLESDSRKIKLKTMLLINDLVIYDERLYLTINNIENFANTNAKKQETDFSLHKDHQKKKIETNELEENKKYKGIVKQKLIETKFIEKIVPLLLGDLANDKIDQRECLGQILLEFVTTNDTYMKDFLKDLELYKKHFANILTLNAKNEKLNDGEIAIWKELLIKMQMFQQNIPKEMYKQ